MTEQASNGNIRRTIDMAGELIMLASQGEADSHDDGCAVLYGVVRDCAYKIKGMAEKEKRAHQSNGRWDE